MSESVIKPKPRSDLGVRTASGVVMMAVAIGAIILGGWFFVALIVAVGIGVCWEWGRLVRGFGFAAGSVARATWHLCGLAYVGIACFALVVFSSPFFGMIPAIMLIAGVIGTDVGAYFAGRTFGGPKIAPKISPSKTWSGLVGGMIGASLMLVAAQYAITSSTSRDGSFLLYTPPETVIGGILLAVIAQGGDFFESWMKRRAGVKDSSNLIPGHGGLFDRTDGLIAVSFVAGLVMLYAIAFEGI
jgi:phosphatidate cytidylyltransferase